ncbi:MAG: type II secretion system protein GspL [Gammaproteobacteria bacterium]
MNPDVVVLTIPRPAGSFSKIRQALPYLLEEQLAEDIEDLHFAVLNQADPQSLVVAIVNRSVMQQCTQELKMAGLIPQTLLPLWLALAQASNQNWLVLTDSDYIWARTGSFTGLACEREQAQSMLVLLYAKQRPEEITWITSHELDPEWIADCEARDIKTSIIKLEAPNTWITYVAKHYLPESAINLLQGDFTVKQTTVSEKRWWHAAKVLGVSIVVVWFAGLVAQSFYLQYENNKLQQQIENVYREVFPNAQKVSNPRNIFERELNSAASGKTNNDFLSLLLRVGEVTSAFPQVQLTGVIYDGNQLVINLNVDNFSRLQQIDSQLQQKGLKVEQENAVSTGGVVQARWRIG